MFLWNPFEILDQSASFYLLNDTLFNKRKCLYLVLHSLKFKKKILHWFWIASKSAFLQPGLWKAAKEVNFYRLKSRDISPKNLDFWLLGTLGRCSMEGRVLPWDQASPFQTRRLPFTSLLPGLPSLAPFPPFCNIPRPCGCCLGTQVYMNSCYHMSPSIALFIL